MEETDIQWSFRLAVRRDGYKKPVISGRSWLHFVQRKGIQRGDGVMFFREDNKATGEVSYWVKPFYGRL